MKTLDLNKLTVEQKIGQLLIARNHLNEEDRDFVYEMVKNKSVAGIQLNYYKGCEKDIEKIREMADYPIFICSDMEYGFPGGRYNIPSTLALAAANAEDLAYHVAAATAIEAKRHGYSMVWSPVVDMVMGPCLCKTQRTLGTNPELAGRVGNAVVQAYIDNGIMPSAKHWPGTRDVSFDSHMAEVYSELTEEDILNNDFLPYKYIMEHAGLPAVMVKHVLCKNIDPDYTSSLSPKILKMLREQGFDGLMISDSFAMMGMLQKYNESKCYGLSVKAGMDLILPNYRVPFKTSYEYLLKSYKDGVFTDERLNDAVSRVIKAQNFTLKTASEPCMTKFQKECYEALAKNSLCPILRDGIGITTDKNNKKLFVILTANLYKNSNGSNMEISDSRSINDSNIGELKDIINEKFPGSEISEINLYPNVEQVEEVCYKATKVDEVIYITYSVAGAYTASIYYTEKIVNLMKATINKATTIIHSGDPHTLESAEHMPRIIAGFGGIESLKYALCALNGEYFPKGIMPVELNLK